MLTRMAFRNWQIGDPAPDFYCASTSSKNYSFGSAAGRYLVLYFFGTAENDTTPAVIAHLRKKPCFDDAHACFFGISIDPKDRDAARVAQHMPGFRYFWDMDRAVSRLYGAVAPDAPETGRVAFKPFTLILDPMMRVFAFLPLVSLEEHCRVLDTVLDSLPPTAAHAGVPMHAPVLIVPRVFEPAFCRELIARYQQHGGVESGFMRQVGSKTVGVYDDSFKKRNDFFFDTTAEHAALRTAIQQRMYRRLIPEIEKAFQYKVTRMERYLVACYASEEGGFFRAHRDNTTAGTAHRRFACTLNLNAEEYDGGELRFPEFGLEKTYRAPTGGAVIFSCSLLHEATPVTRGERYAFLPFLYDDAAALIRKENRERIARQTVDRNKGESEYSFAND